MSAPGWLDVFSEMAKHAVPEVVEAVADGLRAKGFEIPRDPRPVMQEAHDAADEIINRRFHKNTTPPDDGDAA